MPQQQLFGQDRRTQVVWTYSQDALQPTEPPFLYCAISGPRQAAVEHGLTFCPLNVVHEMVTDLLVVSWEAYLFGEPGDVRQAIGSVSRTWKAESKGRRSV